MLLALAGPAGCAVDPAKFYLIDHGSSGKSKHYCEVFDEAYYDLDDHGNVEVVLRSSQHGEADPHQNITQVVYLRGVWRSIPGNTAAEGTQINATVNYWIISGGMGEFLDGAGALFFSHDRRKQMLSGKLESASLRAKRRLAGGGFIDGATLNGEFQALRDPRRVIRIVNDMRRTFRKGPESKHALPTSP